MGCHDLFATAFRRAPFRFRILLQDQAPTDFFRYGNQIFTVPLGNKLIFKIKLRIDTLHGIFTFVPVFSYTFNGILINALPPSVYMAARNLYIIRPPALHIFNVPFPICGLFCFTLLHNRKNTRTAAAEQTAVAVIVL